MRYLQLVSAFFVSAFLAATIPVESRHLRLSRSAHEQIGPFNRDGGFTGEDRRHLQSSTNPTINVYIIYYQAGEDAPSSSQRKIVEKFVKSLNATEGTLPGWWAISGQYYTNNDAPDVSAYEI